MKQEKKLIPVIFQNWLNPQALDGNFVKVLYVIKFQSV